MSLPYEIPPLGGLSVNGGIPKVFRVSIPSRCFIDKIICRQTGGEAVNFTLQIFNHESLAYGSQVSDSLGAELGPIPEECYAVTPVLASSEAGKLNYFSDSATGGFGFPFYSQDKPSAKRQGRNPTTAYVRITPEGAGEKIYALCIGCIEPLI